MSLNAYDVSAGLFIRGLTNLKTLVTKAQDYAVTSGNGETTLLNVQLATDGLASESPADVHRYTLAAQVHWAAEGAKLAIAHLLETPLKPTANDAESFADLERRLNATIAYLQGIAPSELEAGLERTITIDHHRGLIHCSGNQFLIAYAIPHFFYHVTSVYGILRNQGVHLTMSDFLGNWANNKAAS